VAYSRASKATFSLDDERMTSIRVLLSRITTKKVPALALVVVGLMGMVAGVLAAVITVTPNNFTGEVGTVHTNTGTMTVADNGLSIVSNVPGSTNSSATFLTSSNKNLYCSCTSFVAGHWMESIVFTDTQTDSSAHTVKITINDGAASPGGSALIPAVTLTLTGPGAGGGTGTITAYIDLGTASITAPLTVYVSST